MLKHTCNDGMDNIFNTLKFILNKYPDANVGLVALGLGASQVIQENSKLIIKFENGEELIF